MRRPKSSTRKLVPLFVLAILAGCQSPKTTAPSSPGGQEKVETKSPKAVTEAGGAAPQPGQAAPPTYSAVYDKEIKQIFELAAKDRWEEAEVQALSLTRRAPQDEAVQRLYGWVTEQRELQRQRAVEDRIREIDAANSVFNPTVVDLLTEKKDRGLPPRKDLRDAIDRLEAAPYVPDTFGKTIYRRGTMFDVESSEGQMAEVLRRKVEIKLDNVTLEEIIFTIGQAEGINFVADRSIPAFKETLSVNVENVELREFLRYISRNMEVQFQVGDDLIWIVDAKDASKKLEVTRFYRLKKGFVVPAQFGATEVERTTVTVKETTTVNEKEKIEKFVQDRAPETPSIDQAIQKFFKGSSYMIDYERNLIVATGTPEDLMVLEEIIAEFDKAIQQVLIEARFITVSEAAFLELGVAWETGRDLLTSTRTAQDFTGFGNNVSLGLQETFTNILDRPNLTATLTALQQDGESQTLSAPRITVLNNRPARIADGKVQYYYEEYQVKQQVTDQATASSLVPSGKPSKVTAGVTLEVVASVGADGQSILLALHPQVNQDVELVTFAHLTDRNVQGTVLSTFEIKLPELRTQELATRVVVKSGQTVVMGGVHEREQRTFVESVPILGNIPIIGAAFRKRTELNKPRYLLIFVTATLLSESGEFIVYDDDETQ